jgi:hypothetical protein
MPKKPDPKKKAPAKKAAPKKKAPAKAAPEKEAIDVTQDMADIAKRTEDRVKTETRKAVDDLAKDVQPASDEDNIRGTVSADMDVEESDLEIEEDDLYGVSGDDDAERAALNNVRQMLEDEPELFNRDWLRGHYSFTPTDIGVFANEEADAWMDGMRTEDILEKADMQDEYDDAEAWEMADEAERAEMEEPARDSDAVLEAAKELVRDQRYDEVTAYLEKDPFGYWADELGLGEDEAVRIMQKHGVIDIDAAAEEAVSTDGVGHFLSSYDGDLHELSNGMPYILE